MTAISSARDGRPCSSSVRADHGHEARIPDLAGGEFRRDEDLPFELLAPRSHLPARLADHPAADLVADACAVGDRHELFLRDRADLRVVPAYRALHARQLIRVDGHARLEGDRHLATLDRAAQRRLDQQPAARPCLRHRRIDFAGSRLRGLLRGGMGILQQQVRVDVAAFGESDAGAQRGRVVRVRRRSVRRDGLEDQARGPRQVIVRNAAAEQQREFAVRRAADRVGRVPRYGSSLADAAELPFHAPRHARDELVGELEALGLHDAVETVQPDGNDGRRDDAGLLLAHRCGICSARWRRFGRPVAVSKYDSCRTASSARCRRVRSCSVTMTVPPGAVPPAPTSSASGMHADRGAARCLQYVIETEPTVARGAGDEGLTRRDLLVGSEHASRSPRIARARRHRRPVSRRPSAIRGSCGPRR